MTPSQFRNALKNYFKLESFLGQRTPIFNDHWIWKIVDPFLFSFKNVLPYKFNNTLKLKIINWIKPEIQLSDIVFHDDSSWVDKSRQMVAICRNIK